MIEYASIYTQCNITADNSYTSAVMEEASIEAFVEVTASDLVTTACEGSVCVAWNAAGGLTAAAAVVA